MFSSLKNWYLSLMRETNPVTIYQDYQSGYLSYADAFLASLVFMFMAGLTFGALVAVSGFAFTAAKGFI